MPSLGIVCLFALLQPPRNSGRIAEAFRNTFLILRFRKFSISPKYVRQKTNLVSFRRLGDVVDSYTSRNPGKRKVKEGREGKRKMENEPSPTVVMRSASSSGISIANSSVDQGSESVSFGARGREAE